MKREFIAGLRELADFLEAHPELPQPVNGSFNVFVRDKATFVQIARSLNYATKNGNGELFWLTKQFSGEVSVDINVARELVCQRKVTPVNIPECVVKAQPECVVPAHTKEIVEWDCDPILAEAVP